MSKDDEDPAVVREERIATFAKRKDLAFLIAAAEEHLKQPALLEVSRDLLTDLLAILYKSRERVAAEKVKTRRLRGKYS